MEQAAHELTRMDAGYRALPPVAADLGAPRTAVGEDVDHPRRRNLAHRGSGLLDDGPVRAVERKPQPERPSMTRDIAITQVEADKVRVRLGRQQCGVTGHAAECRWAAGPPYDDVLPG